MSIQARNQLEAKPKAELSVDEFNKLYQEFTSLANKDLDIIKGLGEGESYNPIIDLRYYSKQEDFSEDLRNLDAEDMIEKIQEWQEHIKQYEKFRGFYTCQDSVLSGDYEDTYAELESFHFKVEWEIPIEEVTENAINTEFKRLVKHWLAPEDAVSYNIRHVDCKLLTLFKNGKIDWETLRTLVYSDCGI